MESTCLSIRLLINMLLLLVAQLQDNYCAQTAAGSVILESPVSPVTEGQDVTLRCRNRTAFINLPADFYKDDVLIRSSGTGSMIIQDISKSDEGLYKCNISGAGTSPENWLLVKDMADLVILERPVRPVMEGDSVTLRCRKIKPPTNRIADFYKHGFHIGTGYKGEMTIHNVSKLDEGPYTCSISGVGESRESWLVVKEYSEEEEEARCSDQFPGLLYFLLVKNVAIVFCAALLLLVLRKRHGGGYTDD